MEVGQGLSSRYNLFNTEIKPVVIIWYYCNRVLFLPSTGSISSFVTKADGLHLIRLILRVRLVHQNKNTRYDTISFA